MPIADAFATTCGGSVLSIMNDVALLRSLAPVPPIRFFTHLGAQARPDTLFDTPKTVLPRQSKSTLIKRSVEKYMPDQLVLELFKRVLYV